MIQLHFRAREAGRVGGLLEVRMRETPVSRHAFAAALVISGCWASGQASATGARAKRPPASMPLIACTITPLALTPLYATPEAGAGIAADNDDDEDEEEEEEEDEDDAEEEEDAASGFRLPGEGQCVALTASLNTAVQYTRQSVPVALKSRAGDPMSFLWTASIGLRASTIASDGTRIDTRLAVLLQPPTDSSSGIDLKEASIAIGPWTAGYAPSVFNFWTGDEFLFGTRVPARSGHHLSRKLQLTETWSVTAALEDTQSSSAAPTGTAAQTAPRARMPDIVGRLRYEGDILEAHLAGAATELPNTSPGVAPRWGRAVMAGVSWSLEALGLKHSLTGQATWAVDAPVYLGTQNDLRLVRSIVGGGDVTRGVSAAVAWTTDVSDTVSFNAYASHFRLSFPKLGLNGGQAELSRGAANIVWTPAKGFRIGSELGLSRAKLDLPGRVIANDPSGRQLTAILWFDRSF